MILNNKTYTKKVDIINLIKDILNNNPKEVWLNKNHKQILLDLLKNHPSYNTKVRSGIKGFKIRNTQYGKRGFVLYRINGSYTDFSYLQCITHPTLTTKIKQACRTAISQDIINFKIKKFGSSKIIKCEVSGVDLSFNTCHIDHYNPTFNEIFKEWYINKKITLLDLNHSKDNEETTYFTNK